MRQGYDTVITKALLKLGKDNREQARIQYGYNSSDMRRRDCERVLDHLWLTRPIGKDATRRLVDAIVKEWRVQNDRY